MRMGRILFSAGASVLLAAIFVQEVTASRWTSAVVDEPAHLTAGYLSLVSGDLGINREHPPLLKALAALPLLILEPRLPQTKPGDPAPGSEDFEFHYARELLYRANDHARLLAAARLPMILLTVLLGAVLFVWTREIAGGAGALAALALFAFEPGILGHGRLVTTDVGASFFVMATLWTLRLALRRRSFVAALACGALLGGALLSKFSTLLLLPIGSVLAVTEILLHRRIEGRDRTSDPAGAPARGDRGAADGEGVRDRAAGVSGLRAALLAAIVLATAWLCLLAGYGFEGFPLPALYTEGLALARLKNASIEGPTYLMGAISDAGFWSYYVVALLVKTPIPLLLLAAAGSLALLTRRPWRREAIWILLPPAGWILAMTCLTRAQIGVRYVLPAVPFLCAAAGAGVGFLAGRGASSRRAERASIGERARALGVTVMMLIAWQIVSTLAVHPHHLSWFNALAGGPSNGWRWLADSNVDWGQDLAGLRRWQEAAGNPPVNLYYFGTADPDAEGIVRHAYGDVRPGWFAVSATHLAGVYLPDRDYLAVLREREPDARIGGSIFLYHLDPVPPPLLRPLRRTGS